VCAAPLERDHAGHPPRRRICAEAERRQRQQGDDVDDQAVVEARPVDVEHEPVEPGEPARPGLVGGNGRGHRPALRCGADRRDSCIANVADQAGYPNASRPAASSVPSQRVAANAVPVRAAALTTSSVVNRPGGRPAATSSNQVVVRAASRATRQP
ncbi:MAG: hypothetical protein ACK55I_31485, partial [bacterium]